MISADLGRTRSALYSLSADMPRDDWVEIAMAIKAELGEGGFDLFDEWSRQSDRYIARDARDTWKSCKSNGGISGATLFFRAKATGWRDDGSHQKPTAAEIAERRRIAAKDEAEKAREHAEAAKKARVLWAAATPAREDHPYVVRKGVSSVPALREIHASAAAEILGYAPKYRDAPLVGRLLVVQVEVAGKLSTVELIDEVGRKHALAGGAKAGGFWAAQEMPDGKGAGLTLLIGEGVATVLTAREATGSPAVAVLSSANLLAVAREMRERYPAAVLVILADLVKATGEPDPHAIDAARAVAGLVAVPDFGENRPEGMTDFNDLVVHLGLEVVGECIRRQFESGGNGAAPEGTATDSTEIIALEIGEILTRTFPPKEPLLSPWLRRQDLVMIYSKRGVGKTHLCLALAYAIASGGKFLRWEAPEPRRVLYIDGEMPGVAIQERLAALVDANEKEPPEGFFRIVTPDVQPLSLPDLATVEGQAAFQPLLRDSEVIITDNLSVLVRAGVENEGESWVPMATWALARRREGRAVLFVHHAGKGGQQRGSSRREDLLDTVICLKHPSDYTPEDGARFEMVFEKARGLYGADVETIEAALQADGDKSVWIWKVAEGATADRIAKLVGIGMKPAEIASELGIHRSNVYRAISSLKGGKP